MIANRITLGLLMLTSLAATPSIAVTNPFRWYAGGSFGWTSYNHGVDDLWNGLVAETQLDTTDTGWKIFGGFRFSKNLSVEVGFADLNNDFDGDTTLSGISIDPPAGSVSVDIDEPRALIAALVGTVPLSARATVLAKVGASSWNADITTEDRNARTNRSESGIDVVCGAGFQFRASNRVSLRLEWERFANIAEADIDLVSLGVLVRFRRRAR